MASIVIFESLAYASERIIRKYVEKSVTVYVMEPYLAYHKKVSKYTGCPRPLPEYIKRLVDTGQVKLLPASLLDFKTVYGLATDKAVEVVEGLFLRHAKKHQRLFRFIAETLKSPLALNGFKIHLCDQLAEFYSLNIVLSRLDKHFDQKFILFYPEANIQAYQYLKSLLKEGGMDCCDHPNISFPLMVYVRGFLEKLKQCVRLFAQLLVQTILSGLRALWPSFHRKNKKSFTYGISIISGSRQLGGAQRGPGFIIDGHLVKAEEVVYFPLCELTSDQKKRLEEIPGEVVYLPQPKRFFSNFKEWWGLLCLGVSANFFRNDKEIFTASILLFRYFRWQEILKSVHIRHFITHCDFGAPHIGRNLALTQAGVETWYFTDSMQLGYIWGDIFTEIKHRHPFWTYLSYDHLVTWSEAIRNYFKIHPHSFKQEHVVGCLWSDFIQEKGRVAEAFTKTCPVNLRNRFILGAFDSSYSCHGRNSYHEGIEFAKHLIQLADTYEDIYIFFKEKKDRALHTAVDPLEGIRLMQLYNAMDQHPRITVFSEFSDASDIISMADLIISFPVTSTTFEAFCAHRNAIWHDPLGLYRKTAYGQNRGVMTHTFDALKEKVLEVKSGQYNFDYIPKLEGLGLIDPYRDGKAIDRFRGLLIDEHQDDITNYEKKLEKCFDETRI